MQYIITAMFVIVILYLIFTFPGSLIAHNIGQCSAVAGASCSSSVWIDSIIFWGMLFILGWVIVSRQKEKVVASYEGRDFRFKDRVEYNKMVIPTGQLPWMAITPSETRHNCEVKIEPGRFGTILSGSWNKTHITVLWGAQYWREYDSDRQVFLSEFQCETHAEYLDVVSK